MFANFFYIVILTLKMLSQKLGKTFKFVPYGENGYNKWRGARKKKKKKKRKENDIKKFGQNFIFSKNFLVKNWEKISNLLHD